MFDGLVAHFFLLWVVAHCLGGYSTLFRFTSWKTAWLLCCLALWTKLLEQPCAAFDCVDEVLTPWTCCRVVWPCLISLETANWISECAAFRLCLAVNERCCSVSGPSLMPQCSGLDHSQCVGAQCCWVLLIGGCCVPPHTCRLVASSGRVSDLLLTHSWVLTSFYILVNISLVLVCIFFSFCCTRACTRPWAC